MKSKPAGQQSSRDQDVLVFAREDLARDALKNRVFQNPPWKILVVDDEEDVHDITRIALRGFTFNHRPVRLISAYCEKDVKQAMDEHKDIALVLLDVVMEKDNTGLELVEYIRRDLGNQTVRIVLRTGQPGKAPEHEVISSYDINDYKTKPELTAQKLYTSVTACLRAYHNLQTIEKSKTGLELIIDATAALFQNQSVKTFSGQVLSRLLKILQLENDSSINCAYAVGMPGGDVMVMAGTGQYAAYVGRPLEQSLPSSVIRFYQDHRSSGGEQVLDSSYTGIFHTREGFSSLLHLAGINRLSSIDKRLIRIYASNISIGFDNLSLAREIINTQKEVILTLGEVVETRSRETAHHVTRVAEFCFLLAGKYGLDNDTAELLRMASPMHDVGKIGIPEAILTKPGRLTPEEFDVVKTHARIGYEILRNSKRPIMETAAIVALQHHEHWDGKGYPQQLSGENIHVFGRIAAIADVFDALTHKRCYKDAWPVESVLSFFRDQEGRQFDPVLTRLFLFYADEFIHINTRFPE